MNASPLLLLFLITASLLAHPSSFLAPLPSFRCARVSGSHLLPPHLATPIITPKSQLSQDVLPPYIRCSRVNGRMRAARHHGPAGPLLRACPLRCSGHGASPGHRWGGGGVGQATEGWGGQDMRQPPVEWGGGRRGLPRQIYAPLLLSPLKAVRGDAVRSFDELSAARGGLGRFPGSEVMTLLKQFAGVGRVAP